VFLCTGEACEVMVLYQYLSQHNLAKITLEDTESLQI